MSPPLDPPKHYIFIKPTFGSHHMTHEIMHTKYYNPENARYLAYRNILSISQYIEHIAIY